MAADRAGTHLRSLHSATACADGCLGLLSTPGQAGGSALVPLLLLLLLLPGPPSEVHHDPAVVADAERHPDGRLVVAVTASPICRLLPANLPELNDAGSMACLADHVGVPTYWMRRNLLA